MTARVANVATCALALGTLLSACGRPGPAFDRTLAISHDGTRTTVRVAVATTESERERGLMGVRTLPREDGMEFEFARPTTRGFWMKDTLLPLSVAFWDRAGRIVAILDMTPCRKDPCPIYSPRHPYVGALEVQRGFFRLHGISVGDQVERP
jgi:uncharacterized protein